MGCIGVLALCQSVRANDWDRALYGGLMGGAVGAIVGHNSGMRTEVAVPVFAATGALLGYASDGRHDDYDDVGYCNRHGDPYSYSAYPRYGYGPYRYRDYDMPRYHEPKAPKAPKKPLPYQMVAPANLTPGVDLVRVPMAMPNGTSVDITLIRMPDHYVGPHGETYKDLPTGDILAAEYLPKAK